MIYFIHATNDDRIKIGVSDNPVARLRQLRTGASSQKPYIMRAVLPGGRKREREFHELFHKYHSHGEWYNPGDELQDFIRHETKGEFKFCRVCGKFYLSTPDESDIIGHCKLHRAIRDGAYPYEIREFMKQMAWLKLGNDKPTVEISTSHKDDDAMKRVIVYAWWAREREAGLPNTEFDDYILDYMDYLDARFSGDKGNLELVSDKLRQHWGKV